MSSVSEFYIAVPENLLDTSFESNASDATVDSQSSASSDASTVENPDFVEFSASSDDDSVDAGEAGELELVTDSDTSVPDVESIGLSYLESPAREDIIMIEPGNDVGSNAEFGDVGDLEGDTDANHEGELWWVVESEDTGSQKRSTCVECGRDVVGPRFHHCRKCWTKWKSYYATLGRRKREKKVKRLGRRLSHSQESDTSFGSGPSTSSSSSSRVPRRGSETSSGSSAYSQSSQGSSTSAFTEPDEDEDNRCVNCGEGPAEMSLEHTSVLHQCVCLPCSKALMRLPKSKRKCPLCGRRFVGALRVFRS